MLSGINSEILFKDSPHVSPGITSKIPLEIHSLTLQGVDSEISQKLI